MARLWFDQTHGGRRFEDPIRRTVTETADVPFGTTTPNPTPLRRGRPAA